MLQMITLVCQHHRQWQFHRIAGLHLRRQSVLRHLSDNCNLTSRIHLDARMHAPVRNTVRPASALATAVVPE